MRDERLYWFSEAHIYYEIDMLHRTSLRLLGREDGVYNNALVESYALHLRNMIEFLYLSPKRDDDVNALHYVKSKSAWLEARGKEPPPGLAAAKIRADKQVAHLTKRRFADGAPEKLWRPGVELPEITTGLALFLEHAKPELLHRKVLDATDRLRALANPAGGPGPR